MVVNIYLFNKGYIYIYVVSCQCHVCVPHTHTQTTEGHRGVCVTRVCLKLTLNNVKHLLHVTSNIQHLRSNMLHVTWYLYVHTDSPNCYCYLLYKLYTCSLVMTCQRQFRYPGYHHHRIPLYHNLHTLCSM